jgi:hypothetical protein
MPQVAQLTTFRHARDQFMKNAQRSYFHWWAYFSCRACALIAAFLLVWAYALDRRHGGRKTPVLVFAACIGATGILIVFLNCFFTRFHPRFTLPMIELLFLSALISSSILLNHKTSTGQVGSRVRSSSW